MNSQHVGADLVFAYPTARVAVMGPAGKDFVYKKEIQAARKKYSEARKAGTPDAEAQKDLHAVLAKLAQRYEKELMNPREALSLGSISRVLMPEDTRYALAQNLGYLMRHYQPQPMQETQREFF